MGEAHHRARRTKPSPTLIRARRLRRRAPPRRGDPAIGDSATALSPIRQEQLEACAEPGLAAQVDASAERDRELSRDRKAESGAAAVARPERPEDARALLRRDARPGVGDDDG